MQKQNILFLAARPHGTPVHGFPEEKEAIAESLQQAQRRDLFEFESVLASKQTSVRRAMQRHSPSVVHFSGHGSSEGGLFFEDEKGKAVLVDGEALAGFFLPFSEHLRCVILNSCYSESAAQAIAEHIDHTIGIPEKLRDDLAIRYTRAFYDTLGTVGRDVQAAHQAGLAALRWNDSKPTDPLPILTSRQDARQWPRDPRRPSKFSRGLVIAAAAAMLGWGLSSGTPELPGESTRVSIGRPFEISYQAEEDRAQVKFDLHVAHDGQEQFTLHSLEVSADTWPSTRNTLLASSRIECTGRDFREGAEAFSERFPITLKPGESVDLQCVLQQHPSDFGFTEGFMAFHFLGESEGTVVVEDQRCFYLDPVFLDDLTAGRKARRIFEHMTCNRRYIQ